MLPWNYKISNSKVNKNIAKYGGAIRSEGNVTIIKSTLNNNKAIKGGAIELYPTNDWDNTSKFVYGNLTIINSTLNNNRAKDDGGAINSYSQNNIIKNNKFSKNSATWGAAFGKYCLMRKKLYFSMNSCLQEDSIQHHQQTMGTSDSWTAWKSTTLNGKYSRNMTTSQNIKKFSTTPR